MIEKPLISIITVTYNAATVLEETILSVINQTYQNIEYIIIDGGSTDGTVDVIKKYAARLVYWVSEPDKGIYDAMNKGVKKATGTYCNFMNAGDKFHNFNVLEKVFSHDYCEDILAGIADKEDGGVWYPTSENRLSLLFLSICHQAAFIKTELLKKHPYDTKLKIAGDSKFWRESLIIDNCTYKALSVIVCNFATAGISSDKELHAEEEKRINLELFPPRIVSDYLLFKHYYNPLFRLLSKLTPKNFIMRLIRLYTFFRKRE
jgi:glycosyltransferase involved in cell wall biosynthesis